MTDTPPPATAKKQDFLLFLSQYAPGSLVELTDRLAEVLAAVIDTGKAGSLTYKVKIEPAPKLDDMVSVDDDITAKIPVEDRPRVGIFYVNGGALSDFPAGQGQLFRTGVSGVSGVSGGGEQQ